MYRIETATAFIATLKEIPSNSWSRKIDQVCVHAHTHETRAINIGAHLAGGLWAHYSD